MWKESEISCARANRIQSQFRHDIKENFFEGTFFLNMALDRLSMSEKMNGLRRHGGYTELGAAWLGIRRSVRSWLGLRAQDKLRTLLFLHSCINSEAGQAEVQLGQIRWRMRRTYRDERHTAQCTRQRRQDDRHRKYVCRHRRLQNLLCLFTWSCRLAIV